MMNAENQSPDLSVLSRSIVEESPLAMAMVEGERHIVGDVNPAFCQLTGRTRIELIGNPFAEIMPDDKRCLSLLDHVYRTGQAEIYSEQERSPSHPVPRSYAMWPIVTAGKRPVAVAVAVMVQVTEITLLHQRTIEMNQALVASGVRQHELSEAAEELTAQLQAEIAERKVVEESVRETVERLRFVMESMPQKIFTAMPSGDIDYFNAQWIEFTGLSFEQIKNWGWTQFIHPDDVDENVRAWQHSIDTGKPFQFEHRFRRADRSYRWHLSRALPFRDASGKVVMWIGSSSDIHDQKQSEEALRKAEKFAGAGRMASAIAHEINNPLAAVTNIVFLLQQQPLPEYPQELLGLLAAEIGRVVHITKNTLQLYRQDNVAASIDLTESIDGAVDVFRLKSASNGAQIETDYRAFATVIAYQGELRQVFLNLVRNAVEAGATHIKIRVSEAQDSRRPSRNGVHIIVADNGAGISANVAKNLFEPFLTTKAEKGTGLGLWVTKGIIQKHEGWIRARSSTAPGRSGTSFRIFLPTENSTSPTKRAHVSA